MRHEPTSGTKVPAATDLMFALRHSRPRWSRPFFVVVRFAPKATVRRAAAQRPLRPHLSPATGRASSFPIRALTMIAPPRGIVAGVCGGQGLIKKRTDRRRTRERPTVLALALAASPSMGAY